MAPWDETALAAALAKQDVAENLSVVVLDQVDSTNLEIKKRLRAGQSSPLLLVTDQQTAGMGRRGRSWVSEPGSSLLFSLALSFPQGAEAAAAAGLCFMAGVVECLSKGFNLPVQLKWPNDIVAESGKVAGFLGEVIALPDNPDPVLIFGLGLNVSQNKAALDEETGRATSSLNFMKPEVSWDRQELLPQLLFAGLTWLKRFQDLGLRPLQSQLARLMVHAPGDAMVVDQDGETLKGSYAGLNDSGHLLLRVAPDAVVEIIAGDLG